MPACTWRRPGTCETLGVSLYCRGLEEGHAGPHQEEVLSPSNVHADVLRAFVEELAAAFPACGCQFYCEHHAATNELRDAEAAAQAVREGRY